MYFQQIQEGEMTFQAKGSYKRQENMGKWNSDKCLSFWEYCENLLWRFGGICSSSPTERTFWGRECYSPIDDIDGLKYL